MLSDKKIKAFIPTTNTEIAKQFYKDTLNLQLIDEDVFALEFDVMGTPLRVVKVDDLNPQEFTILGWNVDDISSEIEYLMKKGVSFQKYTFLEQDDQGVWKSPTGTKVAWFKDPDGNILSISQVRKQ